MAFETREQVLDKIMKMEKPKCPYCNEEMNIWEVPPMNFSDGLGWGTPFLFICFNDKCPEYVKGWDNLRENFAHNASYRCMNYPGSDTFECIPVFSPIGAKGQIIDDEVMAREEALKAAIKKGFSILADCYVNKEWVIVIKMLLDPSEPARVRLKAAEMIGDIGELDVIDSLRNLNTGNELIQTQVLKSIDKLHERFFTRECPFCAEIIKSRAKICKHCGKDVAGE